MCYPKFAWLETESPTTMQQYVAYNQQQWTYYNELFSIIHAGDYGDYFNFLLAELDEGPYWSSVKTQLGQPKKEYDPEASVSGTRGPRPTDTTSESSASDSDCNWEYVSDIMAESGAA